VPGEGRPRASRLTADEQRTMITLWAIARSPLFIGGNLTQMDDAMKSLLTNPAVVEMDQHSVDSGQTEQTGDMVVWTSKSSTGGRSYLAVFNLGDAPLHIDRTYAEYGYVDRAQYKVRDLWQRKELGTQSALTVDLPPHGSIVLSLHE